MRIGITDTLKEDKYEQYVRWIHSVDGSVDIQKLSHELDNAGEIENLDGLLLSGGGDVHPRYYGKENQLGKTNGVNEQRDEFEFTVIERALDVDRPILGVCRGMQLMNVYLGGSLTVDLASEGFNDHTSPADDRGTTHGISVMLHSMLYALTGTTETEVNTFHHQAVEKLGKGLMCSAISPDNVAEAGEWVMKDSMPFLMLVQWHPERSRETFFSQKLARLFLREVHHYQSNKRTINQ
ncbi:MAG: gamma-glutamyl-gamma-aminobutyrate hydrolase family protein [Bacteroidota bacterium]